MNREEIDSLISEYGSPLYVFDEVGFKKNYLKLENTFRKYYKNYHVSYSFKTNYTPYVAKVVKSLGGYAEVVSGLEYYIAKKIGYRDNEIIFNGPNKGEEGITAFLNGCILNVDSLQELKKICSVCMNYADKMFEIGLRVNLDIGQSFISRFGIDASKIDEAFSIVEKIDNLNVVGLHCHISRCRSLEAWAQRASFMIELADKYFHQFPKYIDLGSGMYGDMCPEFAAQFSDAPNYDEYANAVACKFNDRYGDDGPMLFTEPGTTLINKYIDFISTVDVIKTVRGKNYAVLNCSEHNLGETCILKELPVTVYNNKDGKFYENLDFVGYTCLEQDVMRRNFVCNLTVGDIVVFGNVGGYSNVLKPPFIWPNCKMIAYNTENGNHCLIKKSETYDDVLSTYIF